MGSSLKVFVDIRELLTLRGAQAKGARRVLESDLSPIADAAMVSSQGRIVWVGPQSDLKPELLQAWGGQNQAEYVSLKGRNVMPAFVECHTHPLFAGNRAHEFEWRMQGQTYQQIAQRGGGIRYTVDQTRRASATDLLSLAQRRCERFSRQGVTTLEVKSGYGLDLETEIRCLQVAQKLRGPRIVSTFLGAHSRSPEFADLDAYVTMMSDQVLPRIARERLAERVDIYIEQGFFSVAQAKIYLDKAQALGLKVTGHCEQLSQCGGTTELLAHQAQSIDHLVYVDPQQIEQLANSSTTAVLLPASDFYLRMQYPPARSLIDAGACVALSTDFNPGTSPTQDLSLVGVLARLEMKMSLPEVWNAYTLGAAYALGKEIQVGSLTVGKYCDFIVSSGAWSDFFYSVGEHPVENVYQSAELIDFASNIS
jgi:imidazolonepropionase